MPKSLGTCSRLVKFSSYKTYSTVYHLLNDTCIYFYNSKLETRTLVVFYLSFKSYFVYLVYFFTFTRYLFDAIVL